MNERDPLATPEVRSITNLEVPDWRRLEVAQHRFFERVGDGIAQALTERTEIEDGTARMIAHVLGRAYGRDSHLADYGRTGEGMYVDLRDEYLALFNNERADEVTREWINWFGTYLVQRENTGSGRQFMNEHLPPQLDRLLITTELDVQGAPYLLRIPASFDSARLDSLTEQLFQMGLTNSPKLEAFLRLPNVDASSPNLLKSMHETYGGTYANEEDALRALSPLEDWEDSLADWRIDHGIEEDALEWNFKPLIDRLRVIYDLVELEGKIYAFAT
ncbi:hypothetical protein [Microbacterium alcoholitolerans]|uniref:hypothetical protein n=1 Tax=unclassified Microbacterium TaxID=2609290 RepID=UPI003D16BFA4